MFLLNDTKNSGSRTDTDLVKMWKEDKVKRFGDGKAAYVENRDQLLNVDSSKTDYLLGKSDNVNCIRIFSTVVSKITIDLIENPPLIIPPPHMISH